MIFLKPNSSRAKGSLAFAAGAMDALTEAYEPVTKRRTKFTAYCGKPCANQLGLSLRI